MARRGQAASESDELPEADCLEGFPHPRDTEALFGLEAAEREFAEAFGTGRLHHAWLLVGPEGVGKATLAYRAARFLLASPDERDPLGVGLETSAQSMATHLVRAQSHPSLLVIRRPYEPRLKRFRTEITVDEVRRLRAFLTLTADPGAWRVVIVDRADEMNTNAANALLKSLEEPPRQTVFLLVASRPGRLLPTIRSRCRTLAVPTIGADDLRKAATRAIVTSGADVAAAVPAGAEWTRLEHLAQGSVRRLLSLQAGGGLALEARLMALLNGLPELDWAAAHALSDEIAGAAAEQRYELFFDLLQALIARMVRRAATGEATGDASEDRLADRLIAPGRLAAWAELWETVAAAKGETEALNLDRKSLIIGVLARLEALARGGRD